MTVEHALLVVLALVAVLLVVLIVQRLLRLALWAGAVLVLVALAWAAFHTYAPAEVQDAVGAAQKDAQREVGKLLRRAERQGSQLSKQANKGLAPTAEAVRDALGGAGSKAGPSDRPPAGGATLDGPAGTDAARR